MGSGRKREAQIAHQEYVEQNFAAAELEHMGRAMNDYPGIFLKLGYALPCSTAAVSELERAASAN